MLHFYEHAISPVEAPEKKDHGDIDILVDEELPGFDSKHLAEVLKAERSVGVGSTDSFAIPYPGGNGAYFQLDIIICRKDYFEWETMMYSYGDLWHIIGAMVTRLGLAINNTGLHLRIAEINLTHKRDALLFLTKNPREMMRFSGFDAQAFEIGFATLDDVFKWATASHLFQKNYYFEKDVVSEKEQRVRDKRPMYRKFVTEWLPQRQIELDSTDSTNGPETKAIDKRYVEPALIEEALREFGKQEEYEQMLRKHREILMKDTMWKKIATALPLEGKQLGQAMVALKKRLCWDGNEPFLSTVTGYPEAQIPALDVRTVGEKVLPWVLRNWVELVI